MNNTFDSNPIDWASELATNSRWLKRIVYARVRDFHAVEDVIQELGLAATNWPARLCGTEAVNRWLYAAAVKQALNYRRTQNRDQNKTKRFAQKFGNPESRDFGPMESLIASENIQWIRVAMQQLPARQREVLLLKHFESWSCKQIAEKFAIAESTVQRHLVNARKRLRIELMRLNDDTSLD